MIIEEGYTKLGSIKIGKSMVHILIRYYFSPSPVVVTLAKRGKKILLQKVFPLERTFLAEERQKVPVSFVEEFLNIFREKIMEEVKHWIRRPILEPFEENWYEKQKKLLTKIVALKNVQIAALIGEGKDIEIKGVSHFLWEREKIVILWKKILSILNELRECSRFGALRSFMIEGDDGVIYSIPLEDNNSYFALVSPGPHVELTTKSIEDLISTL